MHRRRYLATAAGVLSLAGCVEGAPRREADPTETPLARHGVPQAICSEEPTPSDAHRGIADPTFAADWSEIDVPAQYRGTEQAGLRPDSTVIGVTDGDRARAYPSASSTGWKSSTTPSAARSS